MEICHGQKIVVKIPTWTSDLQMALICWIANNNLIHVDDESYMMDRKEHDLTSELQTTCHMSWKNEFLINDL